MPLVVFQYSHAGYSAGETAKFDLKTCQRLVSEKIAVYHKPEPEKKTSSSVKESANVESEDPEEKESQTKKETKQASPTSSKKYHTKKL